MASAADSYVGTYPTLYACNDAGNAIFGWPHYHCVAVDGQVEGGPNRQFRLYAGEGMP
ncbi:hypothetical protein ACWFRF_27165 [Nocardia sp. NPDC055165]